MILCEQRLHPAFSRQRYRHRWANSRHDPKAGEVLQPLQYGEIQPTEKETNKRGYTTTTKTRPLFIDGAAHLIDKISVEMRDSDLLAECETFVVKDNGKAEADGDFHDDCVIAWAIAQQVRKENPYKPKSSSSGKRRALVEEKRRKVVV